MKSVVLSYSLTGNNTALAKSVAKELGFEHIVVSEPKHKSVLSITLDLIFSRTPSVKPLPDVLKGFDFVVFFGPVWMGQVAFPLRAYLKFLKSNPCKFAFCSISGGADGTTPDLAGELFKRTGKQPVTVIDMHIADLLPSNPKPTRNDTSAYHITDKDVASLTSKIVKTLRETMAK